MSDDLVGPVLFRPLAWGAQPMESGDFLLPTGTVSLLLADVEGSTRAWESDPEATNRALAALNASVDEWVGRFDGVRPLEQGEGDSFVAAFSRARDALGAGLAIQLSLVGSPLKLRIGIHTGDVLKRDDRNYAGPTVNRTARIRNLGHGGQTLVSQTTCDLVADHLPEGASLRDLGTHRLRDLARPERIFELTHPDLPAGFPALRSLDAFRHNLPIQRTSFIGRTAELDALRELLNESPLVTVTGAGGAGKTRLALQLGAEVVPNWVDGVWFADLAAVSDGSGMLERVAEVFGLRESPEMPLRDALVSGLSPRVALLILDNCEHVIAEAADLADLLLSHCPRLRLLATSREPLGVAGETAWRLPSLTLPQGDGPAAIAAVSASEAALLFRDRARLCRPGFELSEDNATAVADICRRLDGIPLAIELAAARIRVFTPAQIAQGLNERFQLLTGSARTALPRQQTLQASVDWSYDLLTEPERAVFRMLGVFSGDFGFDAAQAICAGSGVEAHQVLDLVSLLVDKSLVVVDETSDEARYRLLETLRHYATERLTAGGEDGAVRARHRDFYAGLAEEAQAGMAVSGQRRWLGRVGGEYPNIRAALTWSLERGDVEGLYRLAAAVGAAWWVLGPWAEGAYFLDAALELADAGPEDRRAWVTLRRAQLALALGDIPTCVARLDEALGQARRLGESELAGWCLLTLGLAQHPDHRDMFRGDPRPTLEEAEQLARQVGRPDLLAETLWAVAMSHNATDPARAITYAAEAIDLSRAHGLEATEAKALGSLGLGHWDRGEMPAAIDALDRAIGAADGCAAVFPGLHARYLRAPALIHAGRVEEALAAAEDLERRAAEAGTHLFDGFAELVRGLAALLGGQPTVAVRLIASAVAIHPSPYGRLFLMCHLTEAYLTAGELDRAGQLASEVIDLADELEIVVSSACGRRLLSRVRRAQGEPAEAEALIHAALDASERCSNSAEAAEELEVLAGIAMDLDSYEEAARLFGAARSLRVVSGYAYHSDERDRDLAGLEAGLGSDRFEELLAEGGRLSLDAALAYARRGRGTRKRPSTGWAALTPVENQVVALAASGLTNAEIGSQLFISARTVQSHLTHIYAKLGVGSRTELAAHKALRER